MDIINFVNGRENKCAELRSLPHSLDDESAVFTVLNCVDHLRVCPGHPDKQFIELLHAKKGCIKSADGSTVASIDTCGVKLNGEIYNQTVRVAKCEILSQGVKCLECKKYRPTLRAINHRHLKKLASPKRTERNTVVSSKTNFRYLSTPEKSKRFSNMRAETDTSKRNIEQLKSKVASITKGNGVVVSTNLEKDLAQIMEDSTDDIMKQYGSNSFEYIFWKEQKDMLSLKDSRQRRWHPMIIRWCLHIKFFSS